MNSLATLSNGWGDFANFVAGGLSTIRRVMLSFPATYELFPTYDKCCRLGTAQQHTFIDILNPISWNTRDWLPTEYRAGGARAASLEEGLKRARRVGELMRRDLPAGLQQVRIAGDINNTKLWLYVARDNQSWRNWAFRESRGDGTVPVWSAANDFTSLAGTEPAFVEHATIFLDEWVANKLRRELVSNVPPPVRGQVVGEIATRSGTKRLELLTTELDPPIATPGAPVQLNIRLDFVGPVSIGDLRLSAKINGLGDIPTTLPLSEITTPEDVFARRLRFTAVILAPTKEDTFRVDVSALNKAPDLCI